MNRKSQLTGTSLFAGTRHPLPGHSDTYEASLRNELSAYFEPDGPVEAIWIGDIAYCLAEIAVLRAQIAGLRLNTLHRTCHNIGQSVPFPDLSEEDGPQKRAGENARRELWEGIGFVSLAEEGLFDDVVFVRLLGEMSRSDAAHLRLLEQMLFEQMRERDRIINQIERRRRQALRDAIEQAQARVDAKGREEEDTAVPALPEIADGRFVESDHAGDGDGEAAAGGDTDDSPGRETAGIDAFAQQDAVR